MAFLISVPACVVEIAFVEEFGRKMSFLRTTKSGRDSTAGVEVLARSLRIIVVFGRTPYS